MNVLRGCVCAGFMALLLAGCGSGGSGTTPTPSGGGRVTGNAGANAAGGTVRIEGTNLRANVAADGSFTVDGVPPGEYTLSVISSDGQGAVTLVRVVDGSTTQVGDLEVAPAGQITGLVTAPDANGRLRPVPGARVTARMVPLLWAYAAEADPGVANGIRNSGGSRQNSGDTNDMAPPRVTTTDSNGSFQFAGALPGSYSVEVSAEGYESAEVGTWVGEGMTSPVDVQLIRIDPDNANLSGTITELVDGQRRPLAHVRVDLWPIFEGGDVIVRPMGRQDEGNDEPSGGGEEPDDIATTTAPPPQRPSIDPGDNAWYVPPFYWGKMAFTDEQGRYAIRNITPGRYMLTIQRYGYGIVQQEITFAQRDNQTVNATLESNLATVSGTVYGLDEQGRPRPLAGAWVSGSTGYYEIVAGFTEGGGGGGVPGSTGASGNAASPDGVSYYDPYPGSAVTDENGRYELTVEAGHVWVNAWAEGYEPGFAEVDVAVGRRENVDLTLNRWSEDNGGPRPLPLAGRRR